MPTIIGWHFVSLLMFVLQQTVLEIPLAPKCLGDSKSWIFSKITCGVRPMQRVLAVWLLAVPHLTRVGQSGWHGSLLALDGHQS